MEQAPNPKAMALRSPELAPSSIIHSPAAAWGPGEAGFLAAAKTQKPESEGMCPTVTNPTHDQASRGVGVSIRELGGISGTRGPFLALLWIHELKTQPNLDHWQITTF